MLTNLICRTFLEECNFPNIPCRWESSAQSRSRLMSECRRVGRGTGERARDQHELAGVISALEHVVGKDEVGAVLECATSPAVHERHGTLGDDLHLVE